MSMNLHCKEIGLAQTPTHITRYCLFNVTDQKFSSRKSTRHMWYGKQVSWRETLNRYLLWRSTFIPTSYYTGTVAPPNGSLYSEAYYEETWADFTAEVARIKKAIRKHKRLHFYYM